MNRNSENLAIRDYAVIGDGHTAALVGSDGSIDWCCCPKFDSAAVFCRVLDAKRGGWCRIGPSSAASVTREYIGNTAVLATTYRSEHAHWRVTDFMPIHAGSEQPHIHEDTEHRILRLVEGLQGEASCVVEFRPTFDYARVPTIIEVTPSGASAHVADESMCIRSPVPLQVDDRGAASARWTLRAGERVWFALNYARRTCPCRR